MDAVDERPQLVQRLSGCELKNESRWGNVIVRQYLARSSSRCGRLYINCQQEARRWRKMFSSNSQCVALTETERDLYIDTQRNGYECDCAHR